MSRTFVHIAVEWKDGFFYGIGYQKDYNTEQETRLYTSYAYRDKRDAQEDVYEWWKRWRKQGRVK